MIELQYEDEPKTASVEFRCGPKLIAALDKVATQVGIDRSRFIRRVLSDAIEEVQHGR